MIINCLRKNYEKCSICRTPLGVESVHDLATNEKLLKIIEASSQSKNPSGFNPIHSKGAHSLGGFNLATDAKNKFYATTPAIDDVEANPFAKDENLVSGMSMGSKKVF